VNGPLRCWLTYGYRTLTFLVVLQILLTFFTVPAQAILNRYPLQIPVPEDTWLAADLYTPDSTQALPVIFIQTPYNKNRFIYSGMPLDTEDYAFVIMDWRGKYGSAHAAIPRPKFGEDGGIAVDWIAEQPWSNGRIGTYGNSAMGQIQFLTALHHPEHLVCSVPMNHTLQSDYDKYYHGGVKRTEYVNSLANWQPIPRWINRHPTKDGFWETILDTTDSADSIDVPMLIVTGWWDMSSDQTIRSFQNLCDRSDPSVCDEHRLLVGPWTHKTVGQLNQGEWQYPGAVAAHDYEVLAFFDHWLRDDPDGTYDLPRAAVFELGSDQFLELDAWPPPDAERRTLYLRNGELSDSAPHGASGTDVFNYDPEDPVLTPGGRTHSGYLRSGPVDLSFLDSREDILIYDTEQLIDPIEVTGTIRADMYISTNRLDTDVAVLLADVYPDGRVELITDGIRRLRFRNGYTFPQLAVPGTIHLLEIPMQTMAISFEPGHRVRLYVMGSNFPRFDRNLNNGGPMYQPGTSYVSSTTIFRTSNFSSALVFNAQDEGGRSASAASQGEQFAETAIPSEFMISAYPNPFNAATTVNVTLPAAAELSVTVYNVTGQKVAELANGRFNSGQYNLTFDASNLASGLYFVRATVPGQMNATQKVMLVR
jgi:uncharacterized protein